MLLSRTLITVTLAALALPGGAAAHATLPIPDDTPAAKAANRLYAKAIARADRHPACRARTDGWAADGLGEAPDDRLLAQFAALRRPAQAGDAMPPLPPLGFHLYPGASRRVMAADGTIGYLTVGRAPLPGPPSACLLRQQMEVLKAERAARRPARRLLDRQARELRKLAAQKRTDHAVLFRADGAFSGSLDAVSVRGGAAAIATGATGGSVTAFGLVTDGVATVTFLTAVGGPVSTPVHDNVIALTTSLDPKVYPSFELRDAAGTLIRKVGP